ncbi:MAG: glycosyltransferase [Candidatus Sumerlaeota bacterium]|nr:glycosyltransferase [Candidatus Sumerlaeota bacterium]
MTKILVIGTGPLFSPEIRVFSGQSLRTWHFTKPLLNAGHEVRLVVVPTEGQPPPATTNNEPLIPCYKGTFVYGLVPTNDRQQILATLHDVLRKEPFDCIVAVNLNAAAIVCRLETILPMWFDLNGHLMGEAQAKCRVYGDDTYLRHFWKRERAVLRRGDRFSSVSHKQMYAVLGELGAVGRLNLHTFSHPFVSVVPNAVCEDFWNTALYPAEKSYRGVVFPMDAFAVLWSGGFNTWTDCRTLAGALSLAMEQNPRIHFVATGGAIPSHDELTYEMFKSEMTKTGLRNRCHLLDWVETRELFPLYKECDLGINIDSLNYETLFGARNRLTNLMAAGLPVLTTLGTEISEIIDENHIGYTVRIGRVQELADAMLRVAVNPVERRQIAYRAKTYCLENFTYEATTHPLTRWAEKPESAPDNEFKIRHHPGNNQLNDIASNSLDNEAMWLDRMDIEELLHNRHDLESIRGKKLFQLYKRFFGKNW